MDVPKALIETLTLEMIQYAVVRDGEVRVIERRGKFVGSRGQEWRS
ncbi:MAG: hypothetical protein ACI9MC_002562 [Kiritimatiellia bacterium]|jgi:hypothetical protein